MARLRTYHLYPGGPSGITTKSSAYRGTIFVAAATSIQQAYAVTHKRAWIDPSKDSPVGLVEFATRETLVLWDGCSMEGFNPSVGLGHDVGVRAIRARIEKHEKTHEEKN